MPIAFWCILIAGLLPLVAVGFAKVGGSASAGMRYDNHNPRDWLAQQQGRAKRAHAAHLNSFEALPLFAAGVLVAMFTKSPQMFIDLLAIVFIGARVAYIWCYLADQATARSLAWFVGFGASVGLFFVAAFAKG
jgi:uncharacterized MAPEG superfamily protein